MNGQDGSGRFRMKRGLGEREIGFFNMGATDSSTMDEQWWLESKGHEREEIGNSNEWQEEVHEETVRGREEDETAEVERRRIGGG